MRLIGIRESLCSCIKQPYYLLDDNNTTYPSAKDFVKEVHYHYQACSTCFISAGLDPVWKFRRPIRN